MLTVEELIINNISTTEVMEDIVHEKKTITISFCTLKLILYGSKDGITWHMLSFAVLPFEGNKILQQTQ